MAIADSLPADQHEPAGVGPAVEPADSRRVGDGLAGRDPVWIPEPGPGYAEILLGMLSTYQIRGNLVSDAQLAALAVEYGLTVYSADTDLARFAELSWVNPVSPRS